jgi:hypothetical protein
MTTQPTVQNAPQEPRAVVFLRVPKGLHTAIRKLAWDSQMSLNALCVEVLRHTLGPANAASAETESGRMQGETT